MAQTKIMQFSEGIDVDGTKTFGVLTFLRIGANGGRVTKRGADGNFTDEIIGYRVTLLSEAQGDEFVVKLPATIDKSKLDKLRFGDVVELANPRIDNFSIDNGNGFLTNGFNVSADDLVAKHLAEVGSGNKPTKVESSADTNKK